MRRLYKIYQLLIALPIIVAQTIITSFLMVIGALIHNDYLCFQPAVWWGKVIIGSLGMKVKVYVDEGVELDPNQSYLFVANHQGAFDIYIIYAALNRHFKWMLKKELLKIPFVGWACSATNQIAVDKSNPRKIAETIKQARETLQGGTSVMVFPEGARSFCGHMGEFKRGAFLLSDKLQLPVVPITINGSFDCQPRTQGYVSFVNRVPLSVTIHKPISPKGKGAEAMTELLNESWNVINDGLVKEYQGFVANPDQ
ncbi:MAG: 1-acyl-sn-glycerol-3-phosphate acyltransferase [Bacteroidaceae bacterium]|nr:1-acyl-sn-glycerol-3-phosphate acyltransferase [Bacteroidaceae bacterium]